MRAIYLKLLAAALCLSMLCACGAKNNTDKSGESANTPSTENITPDNGAQKDDTSTAPDESGDESDSSSTDQSIALVCTELTSEELDEWADYFNNMDRNGLLRFPCSDLENDPDQLATYLGLLFYDIGVLESEFSEEELALLAETDLWLELDVFRLSREFINSYLYEHFNIPAEQTENLLDMAKLGIYLLQYDAWYLCHSDCAYGAYTFDRGALFPNGTVKLYYTNTFLCIGYENDDHLYTEAPMVVTLVPREDGTWYILSHEIDSNIYDW